MMTCLVPVASISLFVQRQLTETDEIYSFYGKNIICDSDYEALNRLE